MFLLGDLVSIPLLFRLAIAATLWVLFQLLIRFHPRGIEIVGGILVLIGFLWWMIEPDFRKMPPYGPVLILLGFAIHALGRFLRWLRIQNRSGSV